MVTAVFMMLVMKRESASLFVGVMVIFMIRILVPCDMQSSLMIMVCFQLFFPLIRVPGSLGSSYVPFVRY